MEQKGLIHLYTGTGKGKTTAAVGLAVRAAGAGLQVVFVQFMKGRDSAEIAPMEKLGIKVVRACAREKFVFQMDDAEKRAYKAAHKSCFAGVVKMAPGWDVLVLDEAMSAIETGMLDKARVVDFLKTKPAHLEVVLTGRNPPGAITVLAEYCTDMRAEKHPFTDGQAARRGIEY